MIWKEVKTQMLNELKKVDNEDTLEEFISNIVGGFIYSNKEGLLKELQKAQIEDKIKSVENGEVEIKHDNPIRDYLGYMR